MSITIPIDKCPYGEEKLYTKATIQLHTGLTVVVGCNGSGKSTLLKAIKHYCESESILYLHHDNERNGGSNAFSERMFNQDFVTAGTLMASSEGEKIMINFGTFAQKLGQFIRLHSESDKLFILLDGLDSGMSIDGVREIKEFINDVLIPDVPTSMKLYVVITANSFELAYNERCLEAATGNYQTFSSYPAYSNFIMRSRSRKDKRYSKHEKQHNS